MQDSSGFPYCSGSPLRTTNWEYRSPHFQQLPVEGGCGPVRFEACEHPSHVFLLQPALEKLASQSSKDMKKVPSSQRVTANRRVS